MATTIGFFLHCVILAPDRGICQLMNMCSRVQLYDGLQLQLTAEEMQVGQPDPHLELEGSLDLQVTSELEIHSLRRCPMAHSIKQDIGRHLCISKS